MLLRFKLARSVCHFITTTLAPNSDESSVRRCARASLLKWEPLDHPGVLGQLHHGERYYWTTRGMCDCGTELGMAHRIDTLLPPLDPDFSRSIKKLKKQGWSESKIARWLQQAKADAARKHAEAEARLAGPHSEITRWIEFVSTVLSGGYATWIGIFVHWYGGNLTTEPIAVRNRRWLSRCELTEEYLLHAEEDVLHTFAIKPKTDER